MHPLFRGLALLIAILLCIRPGAAQCTSAWSTALAGGDINGIVYAVFVFDDDGPGPNVPCLYVGGTFVCAGGTVVNNVAKWDGARWTALGSGVDAIVRGFAAYDEDGTGPMPPKLFAVGGFRIAGGAPALHIARWDGNSWSAVGGGLDTNALVYSVQVIDEDGPGPLPESLIVGGSFSNIGTLSTRSVARWNGSAWSAMSTGFTAGTVFSLATFDDDGTGPHIPALYAGGSFTTPSGISRWDGSAWLPVGTGVVGTINAMTTFVPDTTDPNSAALFVAGTITSAGGMAVNRIARWNGFQWSGVGTGLSQTVRALCSVDSDGPGPALAKLYAGGDFDVAGGMGAYHIAAWDGSLWSNVGSIDPDVRAIAALPISPTQNVVVAAGRLDQADGIAIDNIAQRVGTSWSRLGPAGNGANNTIQELFVADPDGPGPLTPTLFAGGNFAIIGATPARGIASLSSGAWAAFGSGIDSTVSGIRMFDEDGAGPASPVLIAVGSFGSIGPVSAHFVARWDGSTWSSVGGGVRNGATTCVEVFDEDGDGPLPPALFVGGWFNTAGTTPCNNVARWNGTAWSALGGGIPGALPDLVINDMTVWDEDGPGPLPPKLIVAGRFTSAGGVAVQNIAAWNGANWTALGAGLNADIYCLGTADLDGAGPQPPRLFAGGTFPGYLSYWNGTTWGSLGSPSSTVRAIAVHDSDGDGPEPPTLHIAGHFGSVAGIPVGYVAKWNGQSWSALGLGLNDAALTLASFDPDGPGPAAPSLYVGGFFTTAAGASSAYIARWGCPDPTPCYPNCDSSTSPPLLTANDFQCFLNKFAAQDPYANCDHSTAPPTLNANDFQCFLNAFAAGCP